MTAVEWSSRADNHSIDGNFKQQLPLVQIHGNMRNRSATEIWKWLAFIVKGINRLLKFFKCDDVNILTAWAPLRQRWKSLGQMRTVRKHRPDDRMHQKREDEDVPDSSLGAQDMISPRQGKSWMKRLIIKGLNGKGRNKRGIEFDGESRRTWLTRKRRRIGRVGWVKTPAKGITGVWTSCLPTTRGTFTGPMRKPAS